MHTQYEKTLTKSRSDTFKKAIWSVYVQARAFTLDIISYISNINART